MRGLIALLALLFVLFRVTFGYAGLGREFGRPSPAEAGDLREGDLCACGAWGRLW